MSLQFDKAYLIGGWLSSALWGVFTVLVGCSIYLMLTKRRGDLFKVTTLLMVLMYACATTHVFLQLQRMITALITLRDEQPGPIAYLANISVPLNRGKDVIYITNLVLGDSVIVWRCWAVWQRHPWVAGLPALMVCGTAVAGYGAIAQYFLAHPSLQVAINWGTAMFAVSLTTNILVTALTAGRIWYISRSQRKLFRSGVGRTYRTIVLLVIESGAVVAAAKLTEFVLFKTSPQSGLSGNKPLYIVFEMMPQITGIMPTLIIFVVNAGLTATETYVGTQHSIGTGTTQLSGVIGASQSGREYPLRKVGRGISVSVDVETDSDSTGGLKFAQNTSLVDSSMHTSSMFSNDKHDGRL